MPLILADAGSLLRNWWTVVLRGCLAVLFAIITFVAPGISFAALVLVFGAYALADGVLSLISAFRRRGTEAPRWFLVLEGITGIAAGVLTLLWPAISALVLLYLIAAWALVSGALEVVAAITLRKTIRGEWMLALAGIASIAFGVLLALMPGPGALALVLWIGAYALIFGILLIALGFRLRSWEKGQSRDVEFGTHGPLGTAGHAR